MSSFFEGNDFGRSIFQKRYTANSHETWEGACKRVVSAVARDEKLAIRDEFQGMLEKGQFAAGGRIAYSAGRPKPQMINCYVLPVADSREGWGQHLKDTTIISGTGGGIGTNFSKVRYRGAPIVGTGGESTGTVSYMHMVNGVGNEIKSGGGRRAAYMFALNHDHPDILEFLNAKLSGSLLPKHLIDLIKQADPSAEIPAELFVGKLNCANISVIFMNESPQAFFEKVRNDEMHDLVFDGKVVRRIPAQDLWNLVVENALKNGEPGILNGWMANEMNSIWYARDLECTNPCGEIWMQPHSVCCLGAVVLPRFVNWHTKSIDYDGIAHAVRMGVRFLDDVLDTTYYPIDEVRKESMLTRRIGLGYMGIHDMLLMLGHRYSSQDGRDVVEHIAKFIRNIAYDESVNLAIEKGAFPLFNADLYCDTPFIKSLPEETIARIRKYGIRNCALLTLAPYGTTSIVQGVTSGIESMFSPCYERTYFDGNILAKDIVVHPLFRKFVVEGRDTSHFESADDISPRDHLLMQVGVQKYIDNSISKTINVPQDKYTPDLLSDLYMEFLPQVKGLTIYPVGSRENTPLKQICNKDAVDFVLKDMTKSEIPDDCVSGVCAT